MKTIEICPSSFCAARETIEYSENSAKLEINFELNLGENVFRKFLQKNAALAETNCGPFVF